MSNRRVRTRARELHHEPVGHRPDAAVPDGLPSAVRHRHGGPRTQTGVFRDGGGQVVEMGKHGTSRGTETSPQSTNMDSRNDTDHDQDSTQD